MSQQKIRKVVIPVAGYGTRFLPITKAMPKEMMPVLDKPVIQYVVEEAVASGITDIILVTGPSKIILIITTNCRTGSRSRGSTSCANG